MKTATALQRGKSATETVDVQWQHSFPLPLLPRFPPPPRPTKSLSKKRKTQQEQDKEKGFNTEDEISIT